MKHTKDIHVVYIITKLELGGAQKVCLSLFEGLQQQAIDTYLISGSGGVLKEQVTKKPHVILLDSFKHAVSIKQIWLEIKNFFHLIRALQKLKKKHPNLIVHTHSTKAGIVGRWAAFCAGIKKRIHTIHGYGFHAHQNKIKWFIIYCIELATSLITSHFVCVSSADVKTGIRLFPGFSRKHSIIRAAVNWNQFYTPAREIILHESNDKPFVFGSVSCFKPQKNIFDLLNAFAFVHEKQPNTRLEIIGDGILRTAIEQWIETHSLSHVITLHGWQHDIAPIAKQWNAFTLSSLWEGLPCAVVEARLMGLPVICYDTGGIHDVIIHGKNGFLVQQKNIHELAHKMLLVAQNKQIYTYLRFFHENLHDFKLESMINAHRDLYREI